MPGKLEFIKRVNGSAATSMSITDVFSADFDVYKIVYHCVSDSGSPKGVNMRFIGGSGVISTSNYDRAFLQIESTGTGTEYKTVGGDTFTDILGYVDITPEGCSGTIDVYNPFSSSDYTFMTQQSSVGWNNARAAFKGSGALKETTSCTGFQVYLTSTNLVADSKFLVYGVS